MSLFARRSAVKSALQCIVMLNLHYNADLTATQWPLQATENATLKSLTID